MGTLEQTRDTRRLRWPLSLTRAPQKNFLEATDYQPFLDDLSKSSNPHWGKEKQQFVRKNGESESQGCLSTTSRSRTPAATLSSLSRCWSPAREVVNRWLCLLQSPGGTITGLAPHPGENHKQKLYNFLIFHRPLSFSWGETSRHQSSERWRKAAKN